jgi:nicotinate-nucleotide--dimethylbenzimidazole phosphoribosyltransferase
MTRDEVLRHLDTLTKPPGSLGRLEELAARLCLIQQSLHPATRPRRLVLFAGDHGVVTEGVTAWPPEVTGLMIQTILNGGAASCVLARMTGTDLVLVDVGSQSAPQDPRPGYVVSRVRQGTRNLAREPALTVEEFDQAWEVGAAQARQAAAEGMRVVAAGEMGIGNTTPAACLAMLLADVPVTEAVGRGAGADDVALARKRAVVEESVQRTCADFGADRKTAIAAVGGLEIAAMAGFYATAAAAGLTIVLDGFIATSAALVAEVTHPALRNSCSPPTARRPGRPRCCLPQAGSLLDGWQMRSAKAPALCWSCRCWTRRPAVVRDMATFEQVGITTLMTTREPPDAGPLVPAGGADSVTSLQPF